MGISTLYKLSSPRTMFGRDERSANGNKNPIVQVEKVLAASLRPLPTETGDGTYIKGNTTTGIAKDIGHVDIKDLETLAVVAKKGITGDAVNDREYIMERVIQVSFPRLQTFGLSHPSIACGRIAFDLSQWTRPDEHFPQDSVEGLAAPSYYVSWISCLSNRGSANFVYAGTSGGIPCTEKRTDPEMYVWLYSKR
jgi:hypothetical protein